MSTKKYRKMDKRNHWGRAKEWGKSGNKVKGISYYTSADRQKFKKEIVGIED